jgi:ABC-2 type transport system permease protein
LAWRSCSSASSARFPLVADREKLILKRLNATPLRRWQLVGSNVLMRLLIAVAQTVIIVGVGARLYGVQVSGNPFVLAALVVLGAMAFIALGYVIASFAPTEDAANGMTSVVQFPLMFLCGTFFPIDAMPDFLKTIARVLPLTYLSDALRQVMVDGTPFAPLSVCFVVLAAFLVFCFVIAARFFRWQ